MKKNILIITTGGTIAMKYDIERGVIPAGDLADFLHTFPQLKTIADIDVYEYSNVPSPWMTPQKMFELAKYVDEKLLDYDGVVITHGTDTLEESAYMMDLVLTSRKPVVFTAAMRSGTDLGLDGPRNIVGAVRVACSYEAIDTGVLVVMNDEIHSARNVVKYDTGKVDAFISLDSGVLGIVDPDKVVFYRKTIINEKVWTEEIETNIDLIKATCGMDGRFIESSLEKGAKGIVIEAFGRGNVPKDIIPAIEKAIAQNVIIVIVSRAYEGRVLPEYGYEGGGLHLKKLGAILGGDLKGPKARIKLMVLFGKYKNYNNVKKSY